MGSCLRKLESEPGLSVADRKQQSTGVRSMNTKRNPHDDYDYIFKIVMVGDSGVGKSSMLLRYVDDVFHDSYISTIGVDFKFKTIDVANGAERAKIQIWDTAGQDRFRAITTSFYRNSHGIMVVFDLSNRDTFENVTKWLKQVDANLPDHVPKLLVGNKGDLPRQVSREQAEEFARALGLQYTECSCKDSTGVTDAFQLIAETCRMRTQAAYLDSDYPIRQSNTSRLPVPPAF